MWKNFDVTSCLAQFDKLYLKITLDGKQNKNCLANSCIAYIYHISLEKTTAVFCIFFFFFFTVSYTLLVQFSLQKAHDSIRKAIASISGISPLRIAHLHVSALSVFYVLTAPYSTDVRRTNLTWYTY